MTPSTPPSPNSSTSNIDPLGDRVLIRPEVSPDRSAGGILLTPAGKDLPTRGTVVAVGPGRRTEAGIILIPTLKVGDQVIFGSYAGMPLMVQGLEHRLLSEAEVLAKLK